MKSFLLSCALLSALCASGQKISPETKSPVTFNRQVSFGPKGTVNVNEQADAGMVRLEELTFSEGTIEVDIKGKDVLQRSFVGIAFHVQNDTTYECIYFRPFNFKAADPTRRSHAVQYISLPGNDWPELREQHPLKYEQPVTPQPDPNDWFHMTLVVKGNTVKVYVDNAAQPSLVVDKLSRFRTGKVAFWVGNNSAGSWKNLEIKP
ncbi:hypothetical protein MKQ70_04175 [Chitinophaga sedimenti]|uniref:family 16 glycoside hydrolase n=1 Tax=Chitinophaga sedimenti TaxID=2033606 RepID=UPI0020040050|nr:hypothetical protein [Chitinophaga sedimenti]MCK7554249.1 hypothetical protein [Chitinophaga sedimenti]